MRILGIDPGYAILGWGVLDYTGNRFKTVAYDSLLTDAGYQCQTDSGPCILDWRTLSAATSQMSAPSKSFFSTETSLLPSALERPEAVACSGLSNHDIPVFEYTPMEIKVALTGYGKAEKKQMQMMVKTILNLNEVPKPDDTADAVAAAICHAHSGGNNLSRLIRNEGRMSR